jgi:hypothetical protein
VARAQQPFLSFGDVRAFSLKKRTGRLSTRSPVALFDYLLLFAFFARSPDP